MRIFLSLILCALVPAPAFADGVMANAPAKSRSAKPKTHTSPGGLSRPGAAGPQGSIDVSPGAAGTINPIPADKGPMDNSGGGMGGTTSPNSAGPNGGVSHPATTY